MAPKFNLQLRLKPREKVIFFVCCAAVGIFLVYQFVIKPVGQGHEDIDSEIEISKAKLKKSFQILSGAGNVDAQYDEIVKTFAQQGTDAQEISAMVKDVEAQAKKFGIKLSNIEPQRVSSKGQMKVFSLRLNMEGSFPSLVKFLHVLQQMPRYFDVPQIALEKFSSSSSALRAVLTVSRVKISI